MHPHVGDPEDSHTREYAQTRRSLRLPAQAQPDRLALAEADEPRQVASGGECQPRDYGDAAPPQDLIQGGYRGSCVSRQLQRPFRVSRASIRVHLNGPCGPAFSSTSPQ